MKNISKTSVLIKSNQNQSQGFVEIHNFNTKERLKRALKWFSICFAAALISLFIPLAHFVLVPIFLLSSLIVPFYVYSIESLVIGGKGSCPNCKSDLSIEKGFNKWPLQDLCTHCKSNVEIIKNEIL